MDRFQPTVSLNSSFASSQVREGGGRTRYLKPHSRGRDDSEGVHGRRSTIVTGLPACRPSSIVLQIKVRLAAMIRKEFHTCVQGRVIGAAGPLHPCIPCIELYYVLPKTVTIFTVPAFLHTRLAISPARPPSDPLALLTVTVTVTTARPPSDPLALLSVTKNNTSSEGPAARAKS